MKSTSSKVDDSQLLEETRRRAVQQQSINGSLARLLSQGKLSWSSIPPRPELGRLPEVKDNIDGLLAKKPETTQYVEQPSNTPNHFHHWTGLAPHYFSGWRRAVLSAQLRDEIKVKS